MGHHFLGVSGSSSCEKRCLKHPLKTCSKERYQYSHPRKDRKVTDQHVSGILPFDLFFGLLYWDIESPTWNSWKWYVWFLNMPTDRWKLVLSCVFTTQISYKHQWHPMTNNRWRSDVISTVYWFHMVSPSMDTNEQQYPCSTCSGQLVIFFV